jgi:hypothetical protein
MNRDDYLANVEARLPLPEPQRAEILDELAAHLGDGVADLVARGRDPGEAESEILRRLGSADELARELLRAHETPSRLLVAAGAGVVAALRSGFVGTIAGWVVVALASLVATVGLQLLRPLLGLPEWSGWTQGWNSVTIGASLAIGAGLAGAAAVRVVAARSWRRPSDVRVAVALVGATVLGYFTLVSAAEYLNWASVFAYLAVPVTFVVGARFERLGLPRWRRLIVGTATLLVGVLVVGIAGGYASRGGPAGGYEWDDATHGYEMVAPWWQEPGSPNSDIVSSGEGWGAVGIDSVTVEATSAAALEKFADYRLEAWRALAPGDGWALVPGQTGPFATAPVNLEGATVSGTIAFNSEPDVDWAQIVLTASGPDSHRYLLWASGPQRSEFFGSVASWFAAIAR